MDSIGLFNERNAAFFTRAATKVLIRKAFTKDPYRAFKNFQSGAKILDYQKSQGLKRAAAAALGRTIPGIIIASVTRRCNLECVGCYSKTLRPDTGGELSDDRFMELFKEAADLGVGIVMLGGGEPLLRKSLLKRIAALPGLIIPIFTNGTLMDDGYLDLFSSGRLIPIFSIEGDPSFTELRRGTGVHEGVMHWARRLEERNALFGYSITLTSQNADQVLSEAFLKNVEASGASTLFLIEYVPVQAGTEALVLRAEQKAELAKPSRFEAYPFMTVCLPGDEEAFGGCLAAGRGFVHIAPDGALEACPFAPYSDTSVARDSLEEALESPLLKSIRERHHELTESSGGCALWNKKDWIQVLGSCNGKLIGAPLGISA